MTDDDLTINIELKERKEGSISMRPVGVRPYILIEITDVEDDALDLAIEVGGGVKARPVEELAAFTSIVVDALSEYTAAEDDADVDANEASE